MFSPAGLKLRVLNRKLISYFSTKTYVVGTQKNRLDEMVLFGNQNICYKLWVRTYLQFYAKKFCLSKPMVLVYDVLSALSRVALVLLRTSELIKLYSCYHVDVCVLGLFLMVSWLVCVCGISWPRGYKTFFMLNSARNFNCS